MVMILRKSHLFDSDQSYHQLWSIANWGHVGIVKVSHPAGIRLLILFSFEWWKLMMPSMPTQEFGQCLRAYIFHTYLWVVKALAVYVSWNCLVKITSNINSNLSLATGCSILKVTLSGPALVNVWVRRASCQFKKRVWLSIKLQVACRKAPEFSNHQNL